LGSRLNIKILLPIFIVTIQHLLPLSPALSPSGEREQNACFASVLKALPIYGGEFGWGQNWKNLGLYN